MPHDWTKAPEAEWRDWVSDHLEELAVNQMNLAEKFDNFVLAHDEEHQKVRDRLKDVEHKSSLFALVVSAIFTAIASIIIWLRNGK